MIDFFSIEHCLFTQMEKSSSFVRFFYFILIFVLLFLRRKSEDKMKPFRERQRDRDFCCFESKNQNVRTTMFGIADKKKKLLFRSKRKKKRTFRMKSMFENALRHIKSHSMIVNTIHVPCTYTYIDDKVGYIGHGFRLLFSVTNCMDYF